MNENMQRRAHPRFKCIIPIVISRETPQILSSALMFNYSEGGLYFEVSDPLTPGAYIKIKTDDNSALDPIGCGTWDQRRGEVRWCLELETSGSTRYGCGVQYLDAE